MRHYLGLDVGGTKTFCLIGDAQGNIKGFGRGGTGNWENYGVEPALFENRKAVEEALRTAGLELKDINGIGMGVAGADLPDDYVMLEREVYTPLFGDVPRAFRNDSMAGLRGGTREPFGIVIAAGTDCVCAGRNRKGVETRAAGFGEDFGNKCSGTIIGNEGLKAVWRAREGIAPATKMTELFLARAQCKDVEEFFVKAYRGNISLETLQPMATVVFDAALAGDAAACDILEAGGRYLGETVNAVARTLQMQSEPYEVVMAGSVFKGSSPVLIDSLRTVVHRESPRATLVMPAFEPVVGALLMGMELDVEISEAVYQNLSEQLFQAEQRYGVKFKAE
ncbi:MAG: BadF/BadG/BcrA/BcrD ATPase family protein [FCB group bacterium]|jgi:N-acetylglucosamine kinase-like BadF-type ATPase|nr:BadF/BadG/BcrA/BcrD ATPase family protein [FCB group bacterium]